MSPRPRNYKTILTEAAEQSGAGGRHSRGSRFRGRRAVTGAAVWADPPVVPAPDLEQPLGLGQRVEDLAMEELVAPRDVEPKGGEAKLSQWPFSHGRPGVMVSVFAPILPSQCCTVFARKSGALSEQMCAGRPRVMNKSDSAASTSWLCKRRATGIARHLRLASLIIDRIRNLRPSCVRPPAMLYDQTCPGSPGRRRMHEPSYSHSQLRSGCLCGTFSPALRQMRSIRILFTREPASRRSAVTCRYP